jgi:hypothetical protein
MSESMKTELVNKDESRLTDSEEKIIGLFSNEDILKRFHDKYQEDIPIQDRVIELSIKDISKELHLTIQWMTAIMNRLTDVKGELKARYYKPQSQRGFYIYSIKRK